MVTQSEGLHIEDLAPLLASPDVADRFYKYKGSLTTPGCYESVTWFVMNNHPQITEKEVRNHLYRNIFQHHTLDFLKKENFGRMAFSVLSYIQCEVIENTKTRKNLTVLFPSFQIPFQKLRIIYLFVTLNVKSQDFKRNNGKFQTTWRIQTWGTFRDSFNPSAVFSSWK